MYVDQGWLSTAKAVNSPNSDLRSDESDVSLLVIHNISLPPGQFGSGHISELFRNKLNAEEHPYFAKISNLKVSAHLLIDRFGYVTQFVPFNKKAWHAGVSNFEGRSNCNEYSIGIIHRYTVCSFRRNIPISDVYLPRNHRAASCGP